MAAHSITIGLDTSALVSDLLDIAAAFVAAADRIAPADADAVAESDEPTTVPPEPLPDTIRVEYAAAFRGDYGDVNYLDVVIEHVRSRLGQYTEGADAGRIYREWFPDGAA